MKFKLVSLLIVLVLSSCGSKSDDSNSNIKTETNTQTVANISSNTEVITTPKLKGRPYFGCSSVDSFKSCKINADKICVIAGNLNSISYKTSAKHYSLGSEMVFVRENGPSIENWQNGFIDSVALSFDEINCAKKSLKKGSQIISNPNFKNKAYYGCSSIENFKSCAKNADRICQSKGYLKSSNYKTSSKFFNIGSEMVFFRESGPVVESWQDGYNDSIALSYDEITCEN